MDNNVKESNRNLDKPSIILTFMSIQFLGLFYFGGYKTIFPFILEHFNYSELEVVSNWAFIFSFALLIGFLTRMPLGVVADKISRRQSLTLGTVISSIGITGILFTTNPIFLALLLGALRSGTHLFPLLTRSFVNELEKKRHGRINAFILISANIAGFISPILFTSLLNISLKFLVILSNVFLFSIYIIQFVKIPEKSKRLSLSARKIFTNSIRELFNFKKVILLFMLMGLVNGIINFVQVPYALYNLHLSKSNISFIIGIVSLTNILFLLASGELINKLGIKRLIYLSLLFILMGSVIIVISPLNLIYYSLGIILTGGGILLSINSGVTVVTQQASKETASTSFGGVSSFFFLGSSLVPFLAKEIYILDPIYPFYLIIILSGSFFPIIFVLNIQKKKKDNDYSNEVK